MNELEVEDGKRRIFSEKRQDGERNRNQNEKRKES